MKQALLFISFIMIAGCAVVSVNAQSPNIPVQTAAYETENGKGTEISISIFNNKLYINGAPEHSKLEIKNMLGDKVFESSINSEKEEFYLNLKKGFYIVKVGNVLQRIIVK